MSSSYRVSIASSSEERQKFLSEQLFDNDLLVESYGAAEAFTSGIAESKPDAIVLDFSASPSFAFNLCGNIRANAQHKQLPVLIITDVEDFPGLMDLFVAGANDFILEPFARCEIQARIRQLITTQKADLSSESMSANTAHMLEKTLDDFDLLTKIDSIKHELQSNADGMIDTHEELRKALTSASEAVAKAEYSLQFTDRVAQQVNEVGKLVYHIHTSIKNKQPYAEKEGGMLNRSSSDSVLKDVDKESVKNLLSSLDI